MAKMTAFPELRDAVLRLYDISRVANFFRALALCEAYDDMASLAQERMNGHPEVVRAPELAKYLIMHFRTYPREHINLKRDTIFNEEAIGNVGALRDWQHRGHPIRRTARNYPKRLQKWIAIYEETDFIVEMRVRNPVTNRLRVDRKKNPSGVDAEGALDFDAPSTGWTTKTQNRGRVKDKAGNIITYNSVIEKRNAATGDYWLVATAPFWLPLNYGTGALGAWGMDMGPTGFPRVGGLHFREDAELRIPQYLDKYANYLEDFAGRVLIGAIKRKDLMSAAYDWARRRAPKGEIIDIVSTARSVGYLPF